MERIYDMMSCAKSSDEAAVKTGIYATDITSGVIWVVKPGQEVKCHAHPNADDTRKISDEIKYKFRLIYQYIFVFEISKIDLKNPLTPPPFDVSFSEIELFLHLIDTSSKLMHLAPTLSIIAP